MATKFEVPSWVRNLKVLTEEGKYKGFQVVADPIIPAREELVNAISQRDDELVRYRLIIVNAVFKEMMPHVVERFQSLMASTSQEEFDERLAFLQRCLIAHRLIITKKNGAYEPTRGEILKEAHIQFERDREGYVASKRYGTSRIMSMWKFLPGEATEATEANLMGLLGGNSQEGPNIEFKQEEETKGETTAPKGNPKSQVENTDGEGEYL